ncbi:VQ motif [Musa troglodytarum]|uniref:VQ motif n=1 Tax=Musa troglodytarum TaxID=320322 RepID=A0A9E7GAJ0_9LILI|nr:VQ motif [Musa troglodytarum]
MHDCSRESKRLKPEIRVVHVSSPEIIKTDAANFRELVQRLTGKPTIGIGKNKKKKKKKTRTLRMTAEGERGPEVEEMRELWVEKNSGCFSGKFGEIDGFLQELSDVPLPPRVDVIGEALASYQKN